MGSYCLYASSVPRHQLRARRMTMTKARRAPPMKQVRTLTLMNYREVFMECRLHRYCFESFLNDLLLAPIAIKQLQKHKHAQCVRALTQSLQVGGCANICTKKESASKICPRQLLSMKVGVYSFPFKSFLSLKQLCSFLHIVNQPYICV